MRLLKVLNKSKYAVLRKMPKVSNHHITAIIIYIINPNNILDYRVKSTFNTLMVIIIPMSQLEDVIKYIMRPESSWTQTLCSPTIFLIHSLFWQIHSEMPTFDIEEDQVTELNLFQ